MFGKVNLQEELLRTRQKSAEAYIMKSVHEILSKNEDERRAIKNTLHTGNPSAENNFQYDALDPTRIFHISHIRALCIAYRLRLLDASLYSSGIPEEAISAVHQLNRIHQTALKGFKIAAPSKLFRLARYDDPMLFAPIGNQYYYLVHKWGSDMNRMRKWLVYPFRNLLTFTALCLLISALLTWMMPLGTLAAKIPMASVIVFLFMFKSVMFVALWGFYMGRRKLNDAMWDSKYFD